MAPTSGTTEPNSYNLRRGQRIAQDQFAILARGPDGNPQPWTIDFPEAKTVQDSPAPAGKGILGPQGVGMGD
jgi:hypothetical protein